jgi:lysophospholipase L1-like esterase
LVRFSPRLLVAFSIGALLAVASSCHPAGVMPPPAQAASRSAGVEAPDPSRFDADIAAFEAEDRASPPAPGGVLFVGSSSIRLWTSLATDFPDLTSLNRGFGGSTMSEVLHFADRIVIPYRPRLIVLYAGDNDIEMGRSARQVFDDYRAFVALSHRELPNTRIIFIAVKPSPSRWSKVVEMREANRLIREFAARDSLQRYVDVFDPMIGSNGHPRPELFRDDSLHMTPKGYELWRGLVAPIVRALR